MKKIRTFIAHPVPEEWKERINEINSILKKSLDSKIAWVKPENMHFTLKFMGDVSEERIPDVHNALQTIEFTPTEITAGSAGYFPDLKKPRIIWIGLNKGAEKFCSTVATIDSMLGNLNFKTNQKECHAHLTLGRIKKHARDDWNMLLTQIDKFDFPPATLSTFALYKSKLTPDGPIYSVIHKYGE